MCDRLIELIKQADDKCGHTSCGECGRFGTEDDCLIGLIADYLIENGVIVPPYKCGTVVYVLRSQTSNGKNLYMREERIDHYRTFDYGTFMIFESGRTSIKNDLWSTSVFTTHEEAKQELKEERT